MTRDGRMDSGFSSPAPFYYFALFMPVLFFPKVGLSLEICITIVLVHKSLFLLTILPGGYFYVVEGSPSKHISPEPVGSER